MEQNVALPFTYTSTHQAKLSSTQIEFLRPNNNNNPKIKNKKNLYYVQQNDPMPLHNIELLNAKNGTKINAYTQNSAS